MTFVIASEDTIPNISFQILPLHLSKNQARDRSRASLSSPDREKKLVVGGGERNRTVDLLLAKQALSQLSYTPKVLGGSAA